MYCTYSQAELLLVKPWYPVIESRAGLDKSLVVIEKNPAIMYIGDNKKR